jgi:hypothetical protein
LIFRSRADLGLSMSITTSLIRASVIRTILFSPVLRLEKFLCAWD